ncbi:MAG: MucB/RseB C-terminal domain-containing protein [Psychromonas sp.]
MKRNLFFVTLVSGLFVLISSATHASEVAEINSTAAVETHKEAPLTAFQFLQLMQTAYKELNYELLYLNNLQNQVEPKQLIHGVIEDQEIAYFRFLNGAMRESLHYSGKTSYFEQGSQAYTLQSTFNQSVFANIANFDYEQGKNSYEYIILGNGRIAGKKAIAIRMISKDKYRYSYVVWLDIETHLPLRLDTLNESNVMLEQVMVVSLQVTEDINPWLESLTSQQLPEILHLPQNSEQVSAWELDWLPTGFSVVKNDLHKLVMHENEPVSYIMINDGIVTVSIYISGKKMQSQEKPQIIKRGAMVVYTDQTNDIEVNIVGEIPVATAQRLVESVVKVKANQQ